MLRMIKEGSKILLHAIYAKFIINTIVVIKMNDRIYISTPVNKLAAIVTSESQSDEVDDTICTKRAYMSLSRPPVVSYNGDRSLDLAGHTFGKLTVIGLFIKQTQGKKLKWVVQCKCGYYTIRIGNTIRKKIKNNEFDECSRCDYIRNVREGFVK
jgi:hypothetical protein